MAEKQKQKTGKEKIAESSVIQLDSEEMGPYTVVDKLEVSWLRAFTAQLIVQRRDFQVARESGDCCNST